MYEDLDKEMHSLREKLRKAKLANKPTWSASAIYENSTTGIFRTFDSFQEALSWFKNGDWDYATIGHMTDKHKVWSAVRCSDGKVSLAHIPHDI